MKIELLTDRVLVKRKEAEEATSGGLYLPDKAREKPMEGEVVAVGPGLLDTAGQRIPMQVAVGSRVLLGKYAGQEVRIDDVEYLLLGEDEILGVIE